MSAQFLAQNDGPPKGGFSLRKYFENNRRNLTQSQNLDLMHMGTYEFMWQKIHSLKFRRKKFAIRAKFCRQI
jgi:hypothetical protein